MQTQPLQGVPKKGTPLRILSKKYSPQNRVHFLEKGDNLLNNGIIDFTFRLSQSSEIALES